MYILENPVLQRELLVNLRTNRAFLLLAMYQILLAVVVLIAWPTAERLDLTSNPPVGDQKLVNLFFLGQYVIASLMAPSFAAGTITGEKERLTYEMLLASPMRPGAIIFGKMVASLTHLGMLILASLPIIVLCLPLGGVSLYEVLAAYLGLIVSVVLFGAIGVFCSSYFSRTSSSLVVSYLLILPLVIMAVMFWLSLAGDGELRFKLAVLVLPAFVLSAVILMCSAAAGQMLYPPDVGSEGKEVIDLEKEAEEAVGLVIQPDQFPDRLFAPPKKQELMPDGANPVYDKEIHSEIFSQGTLMLRLVIQISMLLAIPLMGVFLFWQLDRAPWFAVYVVVFNMLVGPVFLAGSMTSERERQTLDLLLTTTLTPWQILDRQIRRRFSDLGGFDGVSALAAVAGVAAEQSVLVQLGSRPGDVCHRVDGLPGQRRCRARLFIVSKEDLDRLAQHLCCSVAAVRRADHHGLDDDFGFHSQPSLQRGVLGNHQPVFGVVLATVGREFEAGFR